MKTNDAGFEETFHNIHTFTNSMSKSKNISIYKSSKGM